MGVCVSLYIFVCVYVCGIELRVAFSMFDKDGDGNISVQEVQESLASLGFHVEPSRVKLMVKHVDTDGTYTTGLSNQCVILLATINTQNIGNHLRH